MPRPVPRLDTLLTVELAEGIEVHLRTAGPFLRVIAWIIDMAITLAVLLVVSLILFAGAAFFEIDLEEEGGSGARNVATGLFFLISFLVWWFYPVLFEAGKKGATYGKRAVGVRVVNEEGTRITMGQAMVRNFIRTFELILPILPLVAFFHPRFQRLGDIAAGTLVVYARERKDPISEGPPPLQSVPVPLALSREEQAAIMAFRDRNGRWSEARRTELVDHLAPLTGKRGPEGISQVLGMARWLEERK